MIIYEYKIICVKKKTKNSLLIVTPRADNNIFNLYSIALERFISYFEKNGRDTDEGNAKVSR
ncbi:hypothetical protein [Romboutsia weinsteinii]|uniref:hypothetical protein n=1 Tax=Romboutsia weinsteinii TaxID=2020949 RepID=UPI0013148B98|nr:hypothetical protein [Romboutsia weinsteinii]